MHYVDTSALVRCYFPDEPDHEELRGLIFGSSLPVVTSEITRVELASAAAAAHRAGRIIELSPLLDRMDADCGVEGSVTLVAVDPPIVLPRARQLLLEHALRTLDAVHLAVADTTVRDLVEDGDDENGAIAFVTRDDRQMQVASSLGFRVR